MWRVLMMLDFPYCERKRQCANNGWKTKQQKINLAAVSCAMNSPWDTKKEAIHDESNELESAQLGNEKKQSFISGKCPGAWD